MKVNLTNRVALVTGAARGIGKSIADTFAENGARVIYADVDLEPASEAAERWPACTAKVMDVTSAEQIDHVMSETLQEFGSLDILVNNAGVNTRSEDVV